MFYLVRYFCMDIDFVVPSIEGDRIIPLYTNSLTLQRQSDNFCCLSLECQSDNFVVFDEP